MAYTDIPTVSVGDLYTAANFNTHLRDNFAAGIPDAFTAQGDIGIGAGVDTIGTLALGTAGQALTADLAQTLGVKWAGIPSFFDWFTFGAFACASLDNAALDSTDTFGQITISDIPTCFGIPDTGAHLYLTSLSVLNTDSGGYSGSVTLREYFVPNTPYMITRCLGGSDAETTSQVWNTQAGLMVSDISQNVALGWTPLAGLTVTVKIWGYA